MIILDANQATAARMVSAIRAMLEAVGSAQANHLGAPAAFVWAEAQAVSLRSERDRLVLHTDEQAARRGRGRSTSWVFRRLHELVVAEVEIRPALRPDAVSSRRASGLTRPDHEAYVIPGRGYFRLPGPYRFIEVRVATLHPLTRAHRHDLEIGRTLVHELVVHAWRDAFFYQPAAGTQHPAASPGTGSPHRDPSHTTGRDSDGSRHNYPDAEADLLDHYYDLTRGHDLEWAERNHPGFSRVIALRGGVMGTRITTFQQRRQHSAEYAHERSRFLQQAQAFLEQRHRMESLERRIE